MENLKYIEVITIVVAVIIIGIIIFDIRFRMKKNDNNVGPTIIPILTIFLLFIFYMEKTISDYQNKHLEISLSRYRNIEIKVDNSNKNKDANSDFLLKIKESFKDGKISIEEYYNIKDIEIIKKTKKINEINEIKHKTKYRIKHKI